jgi:hypothetical protein
MSLEDYCAHNERRAAPGKPFECVDFYIDPAEGIVLVEHTFETAAERDAYVFRHFGIRVGLAHG